MKQELIDFVTALTEKQVDRLCFALPVLEDLAKSDDIALVDLVHKIFAKSSIV